MSSRIIIIFFLLTLASISWGQSTESTPLKPKKINVVRLPDMNIPRASHSAFYANGELMVVGGHTSGFVLTPTAEYFSKGEWHTIPTIYPHDNGMMVMLDGGRRILIAGGHEKNLGIGQTFEAEMYHPATHTFDGFGCLDRKRAMAQGAELDSGRVLILGNHRGNDAFEMYDGERSFSHVKEVSTWRSAPYLLPISGGDVIAFGSVWRNERVTSYDTVDRLKGKAFRVPLLNEWIPIVNLQSCLASESFIGNKSTGDFTYIVAAKNDSGAFSFIRIHDTVFTLIKTVCPVPTHTEFGKIRYLSSAVVDTNARRAYVIGDDTMHRAYVLAIEYDKHPAPLTLYYSDPLPEFGNTTPILLTPNGNLVITGGINNNNFKPLASVWLLDVSGKGEDIAMTKRGMTWPWVVIGLLLAGGMVIFAVRKMRKNEREKEVQNDHAEGKPVNDISAHTLHEETQKDNENNGGNELMNRIIKLMEEERFYLKPDLQISHVAEALGVHRNTVSSCINSQQGCTFSQFVNEYRLRHAKQLMCDNPDMKISVVGLESGFANERSFFRSFKAATDMTPGEWMKRCEN